MFWQDWVNSKLILDNPFLSIRKSMKIWFFHTLMRVILSIYSLTILFWEILPTYCAPNAPESFLLVINVSKIAR